MKKSIYDICNISVGGTPSTKIPEFWNGEIPWLSVNDFKGDSKFVYTTEKTITESGLKNSSTKILKKGDLIISARGTVGELAMIPFDMAYNQSCYGLSVNKDIVKPDYLYYILKYSIDIFKKKSYGSVFDTITTDTFKDITINVPELNYQEKICNILSKIDKKIDNNNNINDNLEKQMNLEFNNLRVKNQKNEVLGQLLSAKDLVDVLTGKEDANFSVENGKYKFFTCSNEPLNCDEYRFNSSSVLIAGNGDFNVKHYTGKFNAYQRTYVLTPQKEYYALLYLSCVVRIKAFKSKSTGSIVKFITKNDIESIPVFIPDDKNILNRLNKLLSLKEKNTEENEYLISLRDFLLPLLMNGQATIE